MKTTKFIFNPILVCILLALAMDMFAQQPAVADIRLTDAEIKQWIQINQTINTLVKSEAEYKHAADSAMNSAIETPVGEQSQKLQANLQEMALRLALVQSRLQTARAQSEAWVWQQRALKNCIECVVTEDGKGFAKPLSKTKE